MKHRTAATSEARMGQILGTLLLTSVAIFVTAHVIPGFVVRDYGSATIGAGMLGLINALLRPLLMSLAFPLTNISYSLTLLIVNSVVIYLAGMFTPGFAVTGMLPAMLGALVMSAIGALTTNFLSSPVTVRY